MSDTQRDGVTRDVLPVHRDLFYGGAWHAPHGGYREPFDPATGANLGACAEADASDVDAAVAAADAAFGPWRRAQPLERAVLAVLRWHDEDQLWRDVNAVEYGLSCSIWTQSLSTAHRAAARAEAGYVWINRTGQHFIGVPFGGYKQSGIGREESFDELLSYTQIKNVHIAL